ncbi:desi2 [Symbiodinium sp. CCMP2592]|nr:desi2 [Symbiodinium sp. CCMP2592]
MECLAAVCQWLCEAAPPPAPGRLEKSDEEEFGPFQKGEASDAVSLSPPGTSVQSSPSSMPSQPVPSPDAPSSAAVAEDAPLPRKAPCTVDDLQRFSVPGQWPKSPASTAEADTDSQALGEESEVECEEEPLLRDVAAPDTQIILNVYDVSNSEVVQWINAFFAYEHAPFKLAGVFHVGVQVGDEEWVFGATRRGTGVRRHKPRGDEQHHFRESIVMGSATVPAQGLEVMYKLLEATWRGRSYSPLQNNCVHFASEVCRMFKVPEPPRWLNRGADLFSLAGQSLRWLPAPPPRSPYL